VGGLVGALVAVVALIAVVGGFGRLLSSPVDTPAAAVDYRASLALAREQAPFHVVFPAPVPVGLRAKSVEWNGVGDSVTWHVGFLTEDGDYLGLYQGTGPVAEFLAASTPADQPAGSVSVGGVTWRTYTNPDQGETALVRTVDGVTTVVTGSADEAELTRFAARLR